MRNIPAIRGLIDKYLLIQFLSCFVAVNTFAQTSLLETNVSVECTNHSLHQIIEELTQNYNVSFSYFKNQLPLHKEISLSVHNKPLSTLLDQVSQLAGIRYQAVGGQIVLRKRPVRMAPGQKEAFYASTAQNFFSASVFKPVADIRYPANRNVVRHSPLADPYVPAAEKDKHKFRLSPPAASPFPAKSSPGKPSGFLPEKSNVKHISYVKNPYFPLLQKEVTIAVSPTGLPPALLPDVKSTYIRTAYQMALLPGISTHGIHPGKYINAVSLNLLAGYSAGNTLVEIGGLSNFNQQHVNGLQISGIANVVGGNKLTALSRKDKQTASNIEIQESDLQGVQLAGLTNIIDGNVFGWQTAGAVNVVKKSLQGIQVAGISNLVNTYSFGMQLAGVSNVSMESLDGVQVAGLYNYTAGELHGIQLGAFNQAGKIEGKRSQVSVSHTGLQLGLLNTARRMNGFQIGLVNIGGNMAGTQIGLINIHKNKKGNGIPIGLLNITSAGQFVRLYASELFVSNLEISTGSQHVQNILSLGYNPVRIRDGQPLWSAGYSIGQVKRPSELFFYSYDAGVAHLNLTSKLSRDLSLLTRARATAGYKVQLQKVVFHVFGGITLNTFITEGDRLPVSPGVLRIYQKNSSRSQLEVWPGFVAGIHL